MMMTLAAACWWTLIRTLVICCAACPLCFVIERWLRSASENRRSWLLGVLLAPAFFPELVVGYAFRDFALAQPAWAELLCSGLLFVRTVPVGAVALLMAPMSELDQSALHCRMILLRTRDRSCGQWFELARCFWHGPVVRLLPALGLMWIVAFQEFEVAALLQTMSWTDWFVAAERVGLERRELLHQTLWPILLQLPVLLSVIWWIQRQAIRTRGEVAGTDGTNSVGRMGRSFMWLAIVYVLLAFGIGCLLPLGLIGWRIVDGLWLIARQRTQQLGLAREIISSGAVAACAGLIAWPIGRLAVSRTSTDHSGSARGTFMMLPGLLGSLLLSLGVVTLFQQRSLRWIYDTPVPWVTALTLWLLPRAAVLQLWLNATRPHEAVHLASLLSPVQRQRSRLLWRLRDQPQFMAVGLLCYWAYCDLPTAYLLAPTGMASGLVRLYNFMHFGRSAALSAEACLFFSAPVVGLCLGTFVARLRRA